MHIHIRTHTHPPTSRQRHQVRTRFSDRKLFQCKREYTHVLCSAPACRTVQARVYVCVCVCVCWWKVKYLHKLRRNVCARVCHDVRVVCLCDCDVSVCACMHFHKTDVFPCIGTRARESFANNMNTTQPIANLNNCLYQPLTPSPPTAPPQPPPPFNACDLGGRVQGKTPVWTRRVEKVGGGRPV